MILVTDNSVISLNGLGATLLLAQILPAALAKPLLVEVTTLQNGTVITL